MKLAFPAAPLRARQLGTRALAVSVAFAMCSTMLALAHQQSSAAAEATVPLGTAGSFAVLAGSAITSTGPSVLHGDLGLDPGTAVSGFPPGTIHGATHIANGVTLPAKQDLTNGYRNAANRSVGTVISVISATPSGWRACTPPAPRSV